MLKPRDPEKFYFLKDLFQLNTSNAEEQNDQECFSTELFRTKPDLPCQ